MEQQQHKPLASVAAAYIDDLASRMTATEVKIEQLSSAMTRIEASHDGVRNNIQEFQTSVARLIDSVERLKPLDTELRLLRDKLLTYESKFQAINEVKSLAWGVLLVVLPGFFTTIMALGKFLLTLQGGK